MKIIARQGKDFLAAISEYEVCRLMGFSSVYDAGWEAIKRKYKKSNGYDAELGLEGVEIDITKVAERATTMRQNEGNVEKAIKTFRDMADALEMAWPELKKIAEPQA